MYKCIENKWAFKILSPFSLYPSIFYTYDSFLLESLLVQFFLKFHHGWYLWNLTSIPKLRLHANIFSFQVASSHSYSQVFKFKEYNFHIFSTRSDSASVSAGFLTCPFLLFFSVNGSLQTFTTQVVGSKVLYTMKYYIHVERFHLTPHRPKFTHITQEKALFKKHLF